MYPLTCARTSAQITLVFSIYLVAGVPLSASTVSLPANFTCTTAPTGFCTGYAVELFNPNGISGVTFGVFRDLAPSGVTVVQALSASFEFGVSGAVSGGAIPAQTSLPYSFHFVADSLSAGSSRVEATDFSIASNRGVVAEQHSSILSNGSCPTGPPTLMHWCREVQGAGILLLPQGIAEGEFLTLFANVGIFSNPGPGVPFLGLSAQVRFDPVPEPGYLFGVATSLTLILLCARHRPLGW